MEGFIRTIWVIDDIYEDININFIDRYITIFIKIKGRFPNIS